MAAVKAPPGGRLRIVSAAGFVLGAAFVAALLVVLGDLAPSVFVGYLVVLGGLIGALITVSTTAAAGITPIRSRSGSTLVVSGLGASISSVAVGYLLVAHPPGNHLPLVALATALGAGGWGAWHVRLGVLDRSGLALGLVLSVVATVGLFAVTWLVGVVCALARI